MNPTNLTSNLLFIIPNQGKHRALQSHGGTQAPQLRVTSEFLKMQGTLTTSRVLLKTNSGASAHGLFLLSYMQKTASPFQYILFFKDMTQLHGVFMIITAGISSVAWTLSR